jgi:hypothetical protein
VEIRVLVAASQALGPALEGYLCRIAGTIQRGSPRHINMGISYIYVQEDSDTTLRAYNVELYSLYLGTSHSSLMRMSASQTLVILRHRAPWLP